MARPRTVSDEEILAAARTIIRRHGPAAPVEAIAAEVGVSQQAVLKRFGTKDALLIAVLRPDPSPALFELLTKLPDERDFAQQLTDVARSAATLLATQAQDFAALRWSSATIQDVLASPDTDPAPMAAIKLLSAWLSRCEARSLIRPGLDYDAIALALVGALQTRHLFQHLFDRPPIATPEAAYVDTVIDTFLQSLATP